MITSAWKFGLNVEEVDAIIENTLKELKDSVNAELR